ncbi:MAG: hypothetical protein IT279_09030 [Ignavibacteriaceae bacterium]|nr:hypothetical protein [Ignavibacteriaceae bacterium]
MKLAIVKDDIDLLRIIPSKKENTIEFKISLLGNVYNVEYWKKGYNLDTNYLAKCEISYHNSLNKRDLLLPSVIHSKELLNGIINYSYKFPSVTDINIDSEFPIPLLKLVYNNDFERIYKQKPDHILFNLCKSNTLEIYFISKEYDYVRFMDKWPYIDLLWSVTTIDYVIDRVKLSKQFLEKLKDKENNILKTIIDFPGFKIICRFYSTEEHNNKLCFFENLDYIHILANTPICLADDETKQIKSNVSSAFAFDLECQLNDGEDMNILEKYDRTFKSSYERIINENINKEIFVIPQIKIK